MGTTADKASIHNYTESIKCGRKKGRGDQPYLSDEVRHLFLMEASQTELKC